MRLTPAKTPLFSHALRNVDSCHFLDALSVPGTAFAHALNRLVHTTAWVPKLTSFALGNQCARTDEAVLGGCKTVTFPLQRGYTKPLITRALGITESLLRRLEGACSNPERCALICTSPYWAPVAERWPGPVVYYSLDFTYAYHGFSPGQILGLDQRLCRVAVAVCPVSERIRDYLIARAGCDSEKITVLPNATLSENLRGGATGEPGRLPADVEHLGRPLAGVIGNMAENVDWILLREAMERLRGWNWLFVGPAHSPIADAQQRKARAAVMTQYPGVCFTGERPYRDLQSYARALDVALLPYRRREPTYSGSATRYYEHLAAGRPMVATRNVAELQTKEPLVTLVDDAGQLAAELERLRTIGFDDGFESARIRASRSETWDVRAKTMMSALSAGRVVQELSEKVASRA